MRITEYKIKNYQKKKSNLVQTIKSSVQIQISSITIACTSFKLDWKFQRRYWLVMTYTASGGGLSCTVPLCLLPPCWHKSPSWR